MLRKNINLGTKKEIPLRLLADRKDMELGFFRVEVVPRGLMAQLPPFSIYETCHSE